MTTFYPITGTSDSAAVSATVAALGPMVAGYTYLFTSSTNCWIKQGTTKLVTCATNANMTDGDTFTIAISAGSTVTYEYDKSANGVTSGNVAWAAGASTAADVAATLATAIAANQPELLVTDNANGTLTITVKDRHGTFTENVAHASFTVASATVPATAADGSLYVPAGVLIHVHAGHGLQLGVIRNTADGSASLTRCQRA